MKKLILLFAVLCLVVPNFASNNSPAEEAVIKETVTKFMDGIDNKDVSAIESVITKEASFVDANNIARLVESYNADDLFYKLRNRKLGGWKRDYKIVNVDSENGIAMVKVQVDVKSLVQIYYISLVKVNNDWKIVNSTTAIFKK
jgi:hypothetical protein